jgi:hypothetical protein
MSKERISVAETTNEKPPVLAKIKLRITHTWEHDVLEGGSSTIGQIVDDMIDDAMKEGTDVALHDLKIEFSEGLKW